MDRTDPAQAARRRHDGIVAGRPRSGKTDVAVLQTMQASFAADELLKVLVAVRDAPDHSSAEPLATLAHKVRAVAAGPLIAVATEEYERHSDDGTARHEAGGVLVDALLEAASSLAAGDPEPAVTALQDLQQRTFHPLNVLPIPTVQDTLSELPDDEGDHGGCFQPHLDAAGEYIDCDGRPL